MNSLLRQSVHSTLVKRVANPGLAQLRQIVTDLAAKDTPSLGSPTENKLRRIEFPPFMKDIFAGEFNKSILSYAEVLNYERYFLLEEQTQQIGKFLQNNKESLSKINERGVVPEDILKKLKSLDLYGLMVPAEYGGAELMNTEVVRLLQELGADLSLSEVFNINERMCTRALVKFGTAEQKSMYLERISTGELWTGFCLAEQSVGSDPSMVKCRAVYNEDEKTYRITGGKTWVANAVRANLLLVFAVLRTKNFLGDDEELLTAFLVEKNTPGVTLSQPYDLAGLNGLQVCDVNLDCVVPGAALLGSAGEGLEVLSWINHENKYFMAAGVVTRLKDLINQTVRHANARKQYGTKLADFELIKMEIGRCTSRVYALESMLYVTAGLADVGTKPDIELESAIVKQFAADTFDYVTRQCLAILGAQVNLKNSPYQQYLAENQVLQSWQGSPNMIKCFIAISGIIHMSNAKRDYLIKVRNPGLHPVKSLRYQFNSWKQKNDMFTKKHKLENYVHPRLEFSAPLVEWSAQKLAYCAETLLMADGLNVQIKEMNLTRLSDMATETYASVCTLSRASRSYVVGHAHANHEICLAIPFIFDSRLRVAERFKQITFGDKPYDGNRDMFYEDTGSYVLEKGGYQAVNPLTKNSV